MSLTALPSEILGYVVANLTSQPQPTSLCNLAQCSRQLYLCAVPHLYRHVTIREVISKGEQKEGQLKKLASLLIRRPDLARLVRHFTLQVTRISRPKAEDWGETRFEIMSRPDMAKLDQAFTLSKEEKANCLGQFCRTHNSHHDFILALLLPTLLKVEKLVVDVDDGSYRHIEYCSYYLEQMIHRAVRKERPFDVQQPFEALTVFIHSQEIFNSRNMGFIASLLKLPAIQSISGGFLSTSDPDLDGLGVTDKNLVKFDSASSTVTSLDLVSRVDLGHLLRAPKALKTFCNRVWPSASAFTDIRDALAPQKNSLEILDLDFCDLAARYNLDLEPMVSFISFNALKVFKSVASFLATTENGTGRHSLINIFPPSLETLHLTHFQVPYEVGNPLEALEHLLAQKSPQHIPSLKKIILEEDVFLLFGDVLHLGEILWEDTQETVIERLRRVAAAHGVSIDLIEPWADVESSGDWYEENRS